MISVRIEENIEVAKPHSFSVISSTFYHKALATQKSLNRSSRVITPVFLLKMTMMSFKYFKWQKINYSNLSDNVSGYVCKQDEELIIWLLVMGEKGYILFTFLSQIAQ